MRCARWFSIPIPDVSDLSRFVREDTTGFFKSLPKGPFEYCTLPDRAVDREYAQDEPGFALASEDMTPRERKRALKLLGRTKGSSTS